MKFGLNETLEPVAGSYMVMLLQIYCWVSKWNNFEYRSVFNAVINKNFMAHFMDHGPPA